MKGLPKQMRLVCFGEETRIERALNSGLSRILSIDLEGFVEPLRAVGMSEGFTNCKIIFLEGRTRTMGGGDVRREALDIMVETSRSSVGTMPHMKFMALHSKGYGGEGEWFPDFELEAEGPEARPTAFRSLAGRTPIRDVRLDMEDHPDLTAIMLARVTGGQMTGALARSEDGMVTFTVNGELSEDEEFHWVTLNLPTEEEGDPPGFDALAAEDDMIENWENQMENWEDRPWTDLTDLTGPEVAESPTE